MFKKKKQNIKFFLFLKLRLIIFFIGGLVAMCGTATAEVIDFENLADGEIVNNQYQDKGVYFLNAPRIFESSEGTQSGSKALTRFKLGSEMDTTCLAISFTSGQSYVSMFIGLPVPIAQNELTAELRAYNSSGDLVDQQIITLTGPGPTEITAMINVSAPSNIIRRVELQYSDGYWEAIDDLTFSDISVPDTIPPEVVIEVPNGDLDIFDTDDPTFPLEGYVIENIGLRRLSIRVQVPGIQERTNNLVFWGEVPRFPFGSPRMHDLIFPGQRNEITVTAEDYAGNTGSKTIRINYNILEGEAELLIITPTSLRAPFGLLKLWKDISGISCGIISLEMIDTDNRFNDWWDLPERVKAAIAYAYEFHGTRYVILGGDGDRFPMRYFRTGRQGVDWGVCWHVSDLYYADLFKSNNIHIFDKWDADNDHIYGEWGSRESINSFHQVNEDNCDLRPDVAVGRVPASTVAEATRYVVKVLNHESNTSPSWFQNVLLFNGVREWRYDDGDLDWLSENTLSGFNFWKLYRPCVYSPYWWHIPCGLWMENQNYLIDNGYLDGYDAALELDVNQSKELWRRRLFDAFNQGVGFVAFFGHGGYDTLGRIFNFSDISSLSNKQKLPVIFARACDTAKFNHLNDFYMDIDGNYPPLDDWQDPRPEPMPIQPSYMDIESMAEAFLVNSLSGSAGYVGAKRGTNIANVEIAKMFFESWDAGNHRLGDMWKYTITRFADEILYGGNLMGMGSDPPFQAAHIHKYQLFGDPSLRVGGIQLGGNPHPSAKAGEITAKNLNRNTAMIRRKIEKLLAKQVEPFPRLLYPFVSDTDKIQVSGQTLPDADLSLSEGLRDIGRTKADKQGNFQIKIKKLPAGLHRLTLCSMIGNKRILGSKTLIVEVHLKNPAVRKLRYPRTSKPREFVLSGYTDFDGTWVELLEGNQLVAADRSRWGGKFILKPIKPIKPGKHIFTLCLTDAAGRVTMMKKHIKIIVLEESKNKKNKEG